MCQSKFVTRKESQKSKDIHTWAKTNIDSHSGQTTRIFGLTFWQLSRFAAKLPKALFIL